MTYGQPTNGGNLRYDLSLHYKTFTDSPMILTLKDAGDSTEAEQDEMFQAVVDLVAQHGGPDISIARAWKSYTLAEDVTSP